MPKDRTEMIELFEFRRQTRMLSMRRTAWSVVSRRAGIDPERNGKLKPANREQDHRVGSMALIAACPDGQAR